MSLKTTGVTFRRGGVWEDRRTPTIARITSFLKCFICVLYKHNAPLKSCSLFRTDRPGFRLLPNDAVCHPVQPSVRPTRVIWNKELPYIHRISLLTIRLKTKSLLRRSQVSANHVRKVYSSVTIYIYNEDSEKIYPKSADSISVWRKTINIYEWATTYRVIRWKFSTPL